MHLYSKSSQSFSVTVYLGHISVFSSGLPLLQFGNVGKTETRIFVLNTQKLWKNLNEGYTTTLTSYSADPQRAAKAGGNIDARSAAQ